MFEQVMHDAEIEGSGRGRYFKDIAWLETRIGKQSPGILDILWTKIKTAIIEQPRESILLKEPKIVS